MKIRLLVVLSAVLLGTVSETNQARYEPPRFHEYVTVTARAPVTCTVLVTAYNSEVGQTDDTPFVTASQTPVRWGVVAARWLPSGSRVRVLADGMDAHTFVVEDMMPPKNWCKMDVWHQERAEAEAWGKRFVTVEVLDVPDGFSCPVQPPDTEYKCPEPQSDWGRVAATPRVNPWQTGT
ncbi:MAG TPA: 3D domain-containing protein [Candidatus Paceibacterota bacterium]|nr:3D domain-containing protein [Candidatus Paceibacterota bacterium]